MQLHTDRSSADSDRRSQKPMLKPSRGVEQGEAEHAGGSASRRRMPRRIPGSGAPGQYAQCTAAAASFPRRRPVCRQVRGREGGALGAAGAAIADWGLGQDAGAASGVEAGRGRRLRQGPSGCTGTSEEALRPASASGICGLALNLLGSGIPLAWKTMPAATLQRQRHAPHGNGCRLSGAETCCAQRPDHAAPVNAPAQRNEPARASLRGGVCTTAAVVGRRLAQRLPHTPRRTRTARGS